MKNSDPSAKLGKLLDRLTARDPAGNGAAWTEPILDPEQPLLNEFLRSFLIWEAGVPAARAAAARLARHVVDFNDLRVCLPDDLRSLSGDATPVASERAQRLRAALSDLVRRTHAVSLEHVGGMAKREALSYLASLEGVPPFVAARVVLVSLGVHAMPMDRRTAACLVEAGAMPEDATPEDAAEQIQRRVKAGELLDAYLGLQAWADEQAEADTPARRARAKPRE